MTDERKNPSPTGVNVENDDLMIQPLFSLLIKALNHHHCFIKRCSLLNGDTDDEKKSQAGAVPSSFFIGQYLC
ncbi:MAG: hypothetical protein NC187_01320 [Candidatus Amulumruptor caecigallinarius]|nr:hypothetical protein [Candidatus Amulumruptor caecigallinarius]